MEEFARLFGLRDLQCLNFTEYRNGVKITEDADTHYSKIPEHFENGNKYGLKNEHIKEICVYRHGDGSYREYHAFVVIKTERNYFSIERWCKYVAVNKSNRLRDVVDNCFKNNRTGNIQRETDWLDAKGTVWQVFDLILEKQILEKRFNYMFRNCQVFAALLLKNFSDEGVKFRKYRKNEAGFPLRRIGGYWNLKRFTRFSA